MEIYLNYYKLKLFEADRWLEGKKSGTNALIAVLKPAPVAIWSAKSF